jgi:hypothetical protein
MNAWSVQYKTISSMKIIVLGEMNEAERKQETALIEHKLSIRGLYFEEYNELEIKKTGQSYQLITQVADSVAKLVNDVLNQ